MVVFLLKFFKLQNDPIFEFCTVPSFWLFVCYFFVSLLASFFSFFTGFSFFHNDFVNHFLFGFVFTLLWLFPFSPQVLRFFLLFFFFLAYCGFRNFYSIYMTGGFLK